MASVRSNSNGNCLIELGRNNKKVRVITRLETVYDVREFRLEEKELFGKGVDKVTVTRYFDKEYTPVTTAEGSEYPVKKCALKYLGNKFTPCTDRARRELMILVLNSELKLVAKFADDQMATALETGPEGGYVLCTPEELAEEHTEKDLITIFNNLCKPEEQITGRFKAGKQKLAEFIYELAKQTDLKPVALPQTREKKSGATSTVTKEKKVGIKQQIRAMFVAGEKATLEELVTKFGEDKKTSITTALSDLKSEKYAGEGGPLNIVKDENKAYYVAPAEVEAE